MSDLRPVTSDPQLPMSTSVAFRTASRRFTDLLTQPNVAVVEGQALERDKSSLIGVPFVVTRLVFRNGKVRNGKPTNYVSVELVTADEPTMKEALRRGRITDVSGQQKLPQPLVGCEEALVINDGGTGICRQAVAFLYTAGLIVPGEVTGANQGGKMGESVFDTFHGQWLRGADKAEGGFDVTLYCPRGTQISEYDSDEYGESYTYYLA